MCGAVRQICFDFSVHCNLAMLRCTALPSILSGFRCTAGVVWAVKYSSPANQSWKTQVHLSQPAGRWEVFVIIWFWWCGYVSRSLYLLLMWLRWASVFLDLAGLQLEDHTPKHHDLQRATAEKTSSPSPPTTFNANTTREYWVGMSEYHWTN